MRARLGMLAIGGLCALVLGACGGDGGDDAAPSTTEPAATASTTSATTATTASTAGDGTAATAAPTGEVSDQAFVEAFESQPSVDPGTGTVALNLAQSLCRSLTSVSGDAAMVLDAAHQTFSGTFGAEPAVALLTAASNHLCPEHAGVIGDYLSSEGLDPPP